jgi:hypothetical protein
MTALPFRQQMKVFAFAAPPPQGRGKTRNLSPQGEGNDMRQPTGTCASCARRRTATDAIG